MGFSNGMLGLCASTARKLPPFRGSGRLYRLTSAAMVRLGADPLVHATMRDGTHLVVDLRSGTELEAHFRGTYEPEWIEAVQTLLDPGATFVDVGANIGFYTIAVAAWIRSRGGSGRVLAFEPFAGNYERLCRNIAGNRLEAFCHAVPVGLSDASAEAELTLREDFVRGSVTGNAALATNERFDRGFSRVRVRLEPLDAIWPSLDRGGETIDVLKLDVEGHEDHCLRGGVRTVRAHRPVILMEINTAYYDARGVDPDEAFGPAIPPRYRMFCRAGSGWRRIRSCHECAAIDNVFLVPEERMSSSRCGILFAG